MVLMKNWANMKKRAKERVYGLFEKVKGSTIGRATFFKETPVGRLRAIMPKRDFSKKRARDVRLQRKVLARMGVPTNQANNVIWFYRIRRISEIASHGGICTANAGKVLLEFIKKNKKEYLSEMKFENSAKKKSMGKTVDHFIRVFEDALSKNSHIYRDQLAQGKGTKEILENYLENEQEMAEYNERLVVKRPQLQSPVISVSPAVFLVVAGIADMKIKKILKANQSEFEQQMAKEHEAFEKARQTPSMN